MGNGKAMSKPWEEFWEECQGSLQAQTHRATYESVLSHLEEKGLEVER